MPTFDKKLLSGSTNGRPISVAATATPGTLIHTAVAGTTDFDEVWVYAVNVGTAVANLTLEWGGVTDPGDHIEVSIQPYEGLLLVAPGLLLQNGLILRAFSDTASVLNITGFVNRISA